MRIYNTHTTLVITKINVFNKIIFMKLFSERLKARKCCRFFINSYSCAGQDEKAFVSKIFFDYPCFLLPAKREFGRCHGALQENTRSGIIFWIIFKIPRVRQMYFHAEGTTTIEMNIAHNKC